MTSRQRPAMWRCKECDERGRYTRNLAEFWLHWVFRHRRSSIWDGTR